MRDSANLPRISHRFLLAVNRRNERVMRYQNKERRMSRITQPPVLRCGAEQYRFRYGQARKHDPRKASREASGSAASGSSRSQGCTVRRLNVVEVSNPSVTNRERRNRRPRMLTRQILEPRRTRIEHRTGDNRPTA